MKENRILIISHNPINSSGSMGKTIKSLVSQYEKKDLAQVYIVEGAPSLSVCSNYWFLSDTSQIKLMNMEFMGRRIDPTEKDYNSDQGYLNFNGSKIFHWLKNGNIFRLIRNAFWMRNTELSAEFRNWLDLFQPTKILFIAGDNTGLYKLTKLISDIYNINVSIYYTDDFIFQKSTSVFHSILKQRIKIAFSKLSDNLDSLIVISEKMKEKYAKSLYNGKIEILMNAVDTQLKSEMFSLVNVNHSKVRIIKIGYFGGLYLNRDKVITKLAKVILQYNLDYASRMEFRLDIYSKQDILKNINDKNKFVRYLGFIGEDELATKQNEYNILLHVESFDKKMINKTRYSISTKIPEYLAIPRVILAIAPPHVASFEYLSEKSTNYCSSSFESDAIYGTLRKIDTTFATTEHSILEKNLELAQKNHNIIVQQNKLRDLLS